ncbi:MAG: HAD hydrolase-like protein, partial [Paramuribaculum sp.]|nr:HAD hydrolase-like protein [Paramuribaculum sp.]
MNLTNKFDSLIFDMDGTLWDAVDTYAEIWNETYRRMNVDARVTREMLIDCMGLTLDRIVERIAPANLDIELFAKTLRQVDAELMPRLGGRLYAGVAELIPELAKSHKLYMVSNCGPHGLDYFLDYTGLRPYFTATLPNGETGLCKADNINLLRERYL